MITHNINTNEALNIRKYEGLDGMTDLTVLCKAWL